MSPFQAAAVFLSLTALVGWINVRTLRWPASAAMVLAALLTGLALLLAQTLIAPFWGFNSVKAELGRLNFSATVLSYLLAFLLFSGGLQADLGELRRRRVSIWSLATLGVIASTALVGSGVWWVSRLLGEPLPFAWALVFGALISPTDPVAVLSQLQSGELSKRIGSVLQGEALFNDGVGLVAFTAALAFVAHGAPPPALHVAGDILREAAGGLVLGIAAGWAVVSALRLVDDYVVELTATLALATGAFALASVLHVSGPIAAAAAGLVVGERGLGGAMSERSGRYVSRFWHVCDEILTALLFLLTGLQVFVIPFRLDEIGVWLAAIGLVAAARLVVVLPWGAWFRLRHEERGASLLLAWGGMRGGVSLALALSLPPSPERDPVLAATFATVVFSVLGQGLSFGPLVRRLQPAPAASAQARS